MRSRTCSGFEPKEQSACNDVLVACRFGIHSEGYVQQRGDSTAPPHTTAHRFVCAHEYPEQRRLAGTVLTDETDSIAVFECEIHIIERTHAQAISGIASDASAGSTRQQPVLQRTRAGVYTGKSTVTDSRQRLATALRPSRQFASDSGRSSANVANQPQAQLRKPRARRRDSAPVPAMARATPGNGRRG